MAKLRRITARLESEEWEKFRELQGELLKKHLDIRASDQATIVLLIDYLFVIMKKFPDVLEQVQAILAKN
ncbi:MAG: hypothetical protein ACE5OZ_15295 [Candidatus Heimdallarchaeota archaeon]